MIRLRSLEREDLQQLRDWRNDPEIFSRVREYRLLNMENQEAWFASLKDDRKTIMFGVEYHSKLIGVCGFTNIDWVGRKAEVSIYIGDSKMRGQGFGVGILNTLSKYAFEECNLYKLWAEIYSNNSASEKTFKKAGYEFEGILMDHTFKNGRYLNSLFYALFKDVWIKKDVQRAGFV